MPKAHPGPINFSVLAIQSLAANNAISGYKTHKKAYAAAEESPRTAAAAAMVESSKKSKWSAVPQISVMM